MVRDRFESPQDISVHLFPCTFPLAGILSPCPIILPLESRSSKVRSATFQQNLTRIHHHFNYCCKAPMYMSHSNTGFIYSIRGNQSSVSWAEGRGFIRASAFSAHSQSGLRFMTAHQFQESFYSDIFPYRNEAMVRERRDAFNLHLWSQISKGSGYRRC